MVTAAIYKGLARKPRIASLPAGLAIRDALPGEDTARAAIFVNNRSADEGYVLKEGDLVTIRLAPAGITAALVTMVVVAIAASIAVGVVAYQAKKAAEEAEAALEKLKSQTNSDIDNRPFLRGASNSRATGATQPYICGRHLFTPYTLCDPFYELSGTDGEAQYANIILEGGFAKQVIDTVGTDDITILELDGQDPQEGSFPASGSSVFADGVVEIAQDGKLLEAIPALNYKTVSTTANEEVPRASDISSGDAEDYVFTLDAHAMDVTVCISFSGGLYAYNDDGDKIATSVSITPQYSLDGGKSWTSFTFYNSYAGSYTNTFSRSVSTRELRYAAYKEFSLADYRTLLASGQGAIQCRVRSSGANDSKIRNSCYVLYYQSVCFDPNASSSPAGILDDGGAAGLVKCLVLNDKERALSTLIGVRLKATASNEDKLSKIFVISSGVARTWDGKEWSAGKVPTRNPAAWALEILTSDTHPMSKYSDDEIDLESFGEFYEHCEENELYFDYVISQKTKKEAVLGYITDSCGAALYTDILGRKAIAIDRPQENALAVYNPQNIISIENKREFARRTDCLRMTFVNSEGDLFEEDTCMVMREEDGEPLELTADSAITDLTASGITTYAHAVKYARRMMAIEALRPKTTRIEVGNEGVFYTPYSKILLQDDSLKIGTGSAVVLGVNWEGGLARRLFLKSPVTVEAGKSYGCVIQCFDGERAVPLAVKVAAEAGAATELEILTEVRAADGIYPEGGEVASFGELGEGGEFERITTPYVIVGISRAEHGFSLELANYDEAIYGGGAIPDYSPNITQKPPKSSAEVPQDFISRDDMYSAIKGVVAGVTEGTAPGIGAPDVPTSVSAAAERDGIRLSCALGIMGLKNDIAQVTYEITRADGSVSEAASSGAEGYYALDRASDGYPEAGELSEWRVRAKALNIYGEESEWSPPAAVGVSGYLSWLAPPVAPGSCAARQDGIYAEWSADPSLTYGDIRFAFRLYYGGEALSEREGLLAGSCSYLFNRSFDKDGYPEKHDAIALLGDLGLEAKGRDLSLYSIRLECCTLQRADHVEAASPEISQDYYGTWIPAEISAVSAEAGRDSIAVEASAYLSAEHYGAPYSYAFQMSKDGGKSWEEHSAASPSFAYRFDREADGYPEAEDLAEWRFRAKAISSAGCQSLHWGGGEAGAGVSTALYGTWLVSPPDVGVSVSGRSITLRMSQPTMASGAERYGTIRHRIQIQKPSESPAWMKPAQSLDPYADEANWQEGEGHIIAESVYTQTMPLTGQTLRDVEVDGEIVRQSAPEATLYRFRIAAFSEAAEAEAVEASATALATGIQDIVQGSVTHDKISTPSLAAISANMGVISSGGFTGSELNYWFLSTILGQEGVPDSYEGAFRVGGEDEYLKVVPVVEAGLVAGYQIFFKAGVFEVSAEASTINGELVIQEAASSLDRTRITPTGTYYEHRETAESGDWTAIAQMRTDGIKSGSLYSGGSLVVTNLGLAERRLAGHDIGRPFLSGEARVWHFDTDFLDQRQEEGLEISAVGEPVLADQYEHAGGGIDFTPAILAVSPYAEIGKVAYGQFRAEIEVAASSAFTCDFWMQYIWNENQVLFDIGTASDRVRLTVANDECYFNAYQEGRDAAPFNAEQLAPGDVIVWNEPAEASSAIEHVGSGNEVAGEGHAFALDSLGIGFERNAWLHVGVILSEGRISCYLDKAEVPFARYSSAAGAVSVVLNDLMGSFILDELYIDAGAAEDFADFAANTDARIPWGALDYRGRHFVLDADGLVTNAFDTELFRAKVREIVEEMGK